MLTNSKEIVLSTIINIFEEHDIGESLEQRGFRYISQSFLFRDFESETQCSVEAEVSMEIASENIREISQVMSDFQNKNKNCRFVKKNLFHGMSAL